MKTLLTTATLATLASSAAFAQVIYTPTAALEDQRISLAPWGSGTITETNEMVLEGTTSIRVSSRNFFQGGIIVFGNPVDLNPAASDKANLFHITVQSQTASTTLGGGGAAAGGGAGGLATAGGGGGGLATGGAGGGLQGGGGGLAGGGGQGNPPSTSVQQVTVDATLTKVRCVVTTTDGLKSEVYIDLTSAMGSAKGWKSVGVPLAGIAGFERTNKIVKSIAFSGDTIGTFYVGELKIVNDTTPLYAEPSVREANLALGDELTISAYGSGGSSQLRYTWDFDDTNGIDVDAEGKTITRRFRKDGTYTITLTVHDAFGLKKPFSTTLIVTVNP
jgi:hypothetical protein